jgi:hypothetical protein
MSLLHYTTESLAPEDPRLVARAPGVADVERLFAAPASVGRGALAVEGGVSLVGGPGMGKTTMLRQLSRILNERRRIAAALVRLPSVQPYGDASGFYPFLGAVLAAVRDALSEPAAEGWLPRQAYEALRRGPPGAESFTAVAPPPFERWMQTLGAAARHGSGLCLLFDDVDDLATAPWKQAFVSALRFTFQSCPGITPVYGVWTLFRDESLAGSNYFRNVTRPVFLAPLANGGPRAALVRVAFPQATDQDVARMSSLVGGHPRLVQRLLAGVAASGWAPGSSAPIDARLGADVVDDLRRYVGGVLSGAPGLAAALRLLGERARLEPIIYRTLPAGLVTSGLVDEDARGLAFVPELIADAATRA